LKFTQIVWFALQPLHRRRLLSAQGDLGLKWLMAGLLRRLGRTLIDRETILNPAWSPRNLKLMNGPTLERAATELEEAVREKPRRLEPAIEPPLHPPPSKGKFFWLGAGIVVALGAGIWLISSARRQGIRASPAGAPATAVVERRDFARVLRLTGTTQAIAAHAVLAPQIAGQQFGSLVITKLVAGGTRVKQGDLLVEFDRQNEIKAFLDKQVEFRDLEDQIAKKRADADAARAKDDAELKTAEDAERTAELEMLKNEVSSRIDAEKHRETLEEAKATLQQLRQTYELKRKAAEADIQDLEIQRDRARQTMLHTQHNEEAMSIPSPMDGVAVLNTIWKNGRMGEVEVGEEIRAGVPFMQVIDPSHMIARVEVNQADLLDLKLGMMAQVHLDAYPGLVFPAKFEELDSIGHPGRFSQTVREFDAVFLIQGSDPRLMPDLSAAVDVEIARQPNALVAPLDSVMSENGQNFMMVKAGLGFEKRPVTIGPSNDLDVVIESGAREGEVVERNRGEP
jgi:HlyD family secretion protein